MKKTEKFNERVPNQADVPRAMLRPAEYETFHFLDTEHSGMANASHWHHHYELMMILQGDISIASGGTLYNLGAGSIAVIPPEVVHCTMVPQGVKVYDRMILHWGAETNRFLSEMTGFDFCEQFAQLKVVNCTVTQMAYLRILWEHISEEHTAEDVLSRVICRTSVAELLARCSRLMNDQQDSNVKISTSHTVSTIIDYILERYTEPELSLDEITEKFYFSSGYLSKLFRTYTGVTVYQYIIQCRIQHAQFCIRNGESIMDSCLNSGFTDYTSFLKSFRKIVGKTPREYLNDLQSSQFDAVSIKEFNVPIN